VAIFEVLDGEPPEMREVKLATKTKFEEGLLLYYRHSFREAASVFQDVLSINPKDKVAQIYLERCQKKAEG